ncbi:hypothetical protein AAZX31_18G111900 [Glycine max]
MWPSGISGSIAYNWSWLNMKTGVKIIHASWGYIQMQEIKLAVNVCLDH